MPFLRPTVAAIATAALAAGTLSVSALPAAAAPAPQPVAAADKLGAHDRALIKQYQQQSRPVPRSRTRCAPPRTSSP
ncbi:hypothetical protein ACFY73_06400 [Streptomyces albidoflavus]